MTISFIGGKMIQTYLMVGDDLKYLSKKNMHKHNKSIDLIHSTVHYILSCPFIWIICVQQTNSWFSDRASPQTVARPRCSLCGLCVPPDPLTCQELR